MQAVVQSETPRRLFFTFNTRFLIVTEGSLNLRMQTRVSVILSPCNAICATNFLF